jgi:hypothetical protein
MHGHNVLILLAVKLSANLYDIYHCCVYSEKTPDDGQRNCLKYVEFYSKNKVWEISAFSWFYYKNLTLCTVTWTSNSYNVCCVYRNSLLMMNFFVRNM